MKPAAALALLAAAAQWGTPPVEPPQPPPVLGAPVPTEPLPDEKPVGTYWEQRPTPPALAALCRRHSCHTREAGMAIDTDGWIKDPALRRDIVADDPWHQDTTSLQYAVQRPPDLDPTVVRYVVIPKSGFAHASIGDFAVVEHRGRVLAAVVGDAGPVGKFGEGSWRLATDFGIPNSGRTGGAAAGVTYTFLKGSAGPRPADEAELLARLEALARLLP